jgi:hypothetical protein
MFWHGPADRSAWLGAGTIYFANELALFRRNSSAFDEFKTFAGYAAEYGSTLMWVTPLQLTMHPTLSKT